MKTLKNKISVITTLILILSVAVCSAQDLGNISKKDIIKFSGGVGLQTTAYTAFGMEASRDPFMWQINMNASINVLGIINAPFSASFSSQSSKLNTPQPFNTFGISPKYKAVTAHIGYRSLSLSEFSLSGSQFLGLGVEVQPKDAMVKGKVLWGRFAEPVYFNPDGTIATKPSFARYGWGGDIILGRSSKKEFGFRMFKAKDDPNSLNYLDTIENIGIKPADNLVLGISVKYEISKQISVDFNSDFSFFTNDLNIPQEVDRSGSYANNIFLFGYNSTSEYEKALSASLKYKPSFAKFSLDYRRVDPGYKTLGISFINNDYEDIKLKVSFSLFNKKTGISLSGGLQRNNLDNSRATQMTRLIGSVGINQKISEKWTGNLNYVNFNSNTHQTIVVTLDSLRFVQTTQTASIALMRNSSTENSNTSLNIAINFQDAIVNDVRTTTFYNSNIGVQHQILKLKLTTGASIVGVHNVSEIGSTSNVGPSVMLGTSVFKDLLMLNMVGTYLSSYTDWLAAGSVANITFSAAYTLFKKHKLTLNISNISKNLEGANTSEITGTLNYSYSF